MLIPGFEPRPGTPETTSRYGFLNLAGWRSVRPPDSVVGGSILRKCKSNTNFVYYNFSNENSWNITINFLLIKEVNVSNFARLI
jgi:hypothetical protein